MRGEYYTQLRNLVGRALYGAPKSLPAQFTGKRQLLEALLLDAVRTFYVDLHSRKPGEQQRFAEVQEWITSEDTEYVFSFVNVCTLLGLDADAVRTHLMTWKAAQSRTPSRMSPALKSQFRIVQR